MYIDLSIPIDPQLMGDMQPGDKNLSNGHLGTHCDNMQQPFPLEYLRRCGLVFDFRGIDPDGEIDLTEEQLAGIEAGMFVAFYTGFLGKRAQYGTAQYKTLHPQLSQKLIETLVAKKVSLIAIDCAGVRRPPEHHEADMYCSGRGTFVIENVWNLDKLLESAHDGRFIANTFPINTVNLPNLTGLLCRVVAEV